MNLKQGLWLFATIAALVILPGLAIAIALLWMVTVIARDDREDVDYGD